LLRLFTHEYVNILRTVLIIVNVKNITLFCGYFLRKTGFQSYFNQVSLRCRHSGVNTPAQTRRGGEKEEKGGGYSLQQKSWNLGKE
jgi:hypothetical protein